MPRTGRPKVDPSEKAVSYGISMRPATLAALERLSNLYGVKQAAIVAILIEREASSVNLTLAALGDNKWHDLASMRRLTKLEGIRLHGILHALAEAGTIEEEAERFRLKSGDYIGG